MSESAVLGQTVSSGAVGAGVGRGLPSVNVLSVATEIPETRVTSVELGERVGVDENWIVSRTGIRERPWAGEDERLHDYAARAGAKALAAANVAAADLDLVIVATITADELTPSASSQVARALGAGRAGALDVGAACTGFLTGLAMAAGQIESGRAQRILLIGADFCSTIIDKNDRYSAPLFSDAAGAVVLVAGPPASGVEPGAVPARDQPYLGPVILGTDGDPDRALWANLTDRQLRMKGTEIFKQAVARISESSVQALAASDLELADIDLFVCHQANARITAAVRTRLGLEEEKVVDCIATLGNSSAATLPIGLAYALADGRLRPGTRVLLSAFGAGFTWGACVLHWNASPVSESTASVSSSSQSSGSAASDTHA